VIDSVTSRNNYAAHIGHSLAGIISGSVAAVWHCLYTCYLLSSVLPWGGDECVQYLLHDADVVINLTAIPLRNALRYPHDIPYLLFLQFSVSVENSKLELPHEG